MQLHQIDFADTKLFSQTFIDYITENDTLKEFYHQSPSIDNFAQQIALKKTFPKATRTVLHQVVTEQYKAIETAPQAQIDALLDENTFTVTTGHQLNLFTGPLYFVYKIAAAINTAKALKEKYPDYNFVPVYWMATEDHDFEEINHFHLFGKTHTWETSQTGAVGRFTPDGLQSIFEEINEAPEIFRKAYLEQPSLAEATRYLVHHLFADTGLIVFDADHPALKSVYQEVIKAEVLNPASFEIVSKTSEKLNALHYKTQVTPREINFFYLEEGVRQRIVHNDNHFEVLGTDLKFSSEEMAKLIEEHPERFSPNVILRPLYQEWILPNLSYIGGPSELVYWLQLKGVFEHYQVPFPMLQPRNFVLFVNKPSVKKFNKLHLSIQDLFLDEVTLRKNFVLANSENEITLEQETEGLNQLFERLVQKSQDVDKSLEGFIKSEHQKALKSLGNIEKRLKKSEERKMETEVNQLIKLKEKLFPNGAPQERYENLLNFYINNPAFISQILEKLNPFGFRMNVLMEEV
ncbi:MAG TPA: bacillithiol biosynthesis cysteine-adding enzyme BshC [Microscillaceae bacterium]|nr:bacillithiol biosynthesis cysteine-adding enzyme BshC [Microscillaceae bacterium]